MPLRVQIFWASENYLFHAYSLSRFQQLQVRAHPAPRSHCSSSLLLLWQIVAAQDEAKESAAAAVAASKEQKEGKKEVKEQKEARAAFVVLRSFIQASVLVLTRGCCSQEPTAEEKRRLASAVLIAT